MKRLLFDSMLFVSVFILPWWITVSLAFIGMFLFKNFYEFLCVSIVMYTLFAVPGDRFITSRVWFPISISLLYIGLQAFRSRMIVYNNEY